MFISIFRSVPSVNNLFLQRNQQQSEGQIKTEPPLIAGVSIGNFGEDDEDQSGNLQHTWSFGNVFCMIIWECFLYKTIHSKFFFCLLILHFSCSVDEEEYFSEENEEFVGGSEFPSKTMSTNSVDQGSRRLNSRCDCPNCLGMLLK